MSIFFLLGAELLDVGGGDYAGGKGYDCYSEEAADHAYESAHVGYGGDVAVADGGQGYGGPVEGVKEVREGFLAGFGVDVGLGVEHYQGRYEYVENGDSEYCEQDSLLTFDYVAQDFDVLGVSDELEKS